VRQSGDSQRAWRADKRCQAQPQLARYCAVHSARYNSAGQPHSIRFVHRTYSASDIARLPILGKCLISMDNGGFVVVCRVRVEACRDRRCHNVRGESDGYRWSTSTR